MTTQMLTYKVRAYPTRTQHARLADCLRHTRELYNAALLERVDCYRKTGRTISSFEQQRSLTELRKEPEFAIYPRRMQCWALDLVDAAYKGLFTRHRQGARGRQIGFPRFRGRAFWSTIGWNSPCDFRMTERGLVNRKSLGGTLRLRPHRPLPDFAACKMLVLSRDGDRWFAHLTYEVEARLLKASPSRPVGIDVGLKVAAARSDGALIDIVRPYREQEAELRRRQRALSRCSRRSKRRRRAREQVRRLHQKIRARRRDALHQVSARLVHHFDAIAVENLNLRGLNRSGGHDAQGRGTRKSWRDRAPGQLLDMLEWKCQRDGRPFMRVDPRHTSQICPECGVIHPKTLAERTHRCSDCGAVLDRDVAAAQVILRRASEAEWGLADVKPGGGPACPANTAAMPPDHGSGAAASLLHPTTRKRRARADRFSRSRAAIAGASNA